MFSVFLEIASSAIGAISGVLAVAFLIVTIRSAFSGRAAYETNRAVTKPSFWSTLKGDMRDGSVTGEGRTNHGLAVELDTGRLIPQQRLGSDAINEVIGRQS